MWYHITAVYNPDTSLKIYVNGELKNTNTSSIPSSIFNSNASLWIGAQYDTTSLFDGLIDNVKVFNRTLTDDEIKVLADK